MPCQTQQQPQQQPQPQPQPQIYYPNSYNQAPIPNQYFATIPQVLPTVTTPVSQKHIHRCTIHFSQVYCIRHKRTLEEKLSSRTVMQLRVHYFCLVFLIVKFRKS